MFCFYILYCTVCTNKKYINHTYSKFIFIIYKINYDLNLNTQFKKTSKNTQIGREGLSTFMLVLLHTTHLKHNNKLT